MNPSDNQTENPLAAGSVITPGGATPQTGPQPILESAGEPIKVSVNTPTPPAPQPVAAAPTPPLPPAPIQPDPMPIPPKPTPPVPTQPNLPPQAMEHPLFQSTPSYLPTSPLETPPSPQPVERKRSFLKPLLLIGLLALIIFGGSAAAYFVAIAPNKPENIWAKALTNTGRGYDKLVQYATSQKNVKAVDISGGYKVSGGLASDGTFNGSFSDGNGQLTGSGSGFGLKVNFDLRWIKSQGNSPDIYFKVDGVQGLGDLASQFTNSPELKGLNNLNGQWYVVDHSLFDSFASGSNATPQISQSAIKDLLNRIGTTSKKYIFTNDSGKMAVVVKQKVGKEKIDGLNTYHFVVGFNKQNAQNYFKEVCADIKDANLSDTLVTNSFGESLGCSNGSLSLADELKDSDSADAWVDLHTKLLYKIRFSEKDKKDNYLEIGQKYSGGDSFPLFLNTNQKSANLTSSSNTDLTLNTKTNVVELKSTFKYGGQPATTGTFNISLKPGSSTKKIDAPSGAKNILQLLSDIGVAEPGSF